MKQILLFTVVSVLLLSVCLPGLGEQSEIKGKVRVLLAGFELEDTMDPVTMREHEGLLSLYEKTFKPKFPNIEVDFASVPWNNAQQKQQLELAAGNVDVLYTGSYVVQFFEQGLVRTIDDLVAADTELKLYDIFPEGLMRTSYSMTSSDGELFGLPAVMGQRYTIMDTKLFDEWGVEYLSEYPTPEEIIEKAAKMTGINPVTGEQNYGVWFNTTFPTDIFTFASWAYAFKADGGEGHPANPKDIKWNLNGPEMYALLDAYGRMVVSTPPGFVTGSGSERFAEEDNNVAIYLDHNGAGIINRYLESNDDSMIKRFRGVMNVGPKGEGWVAADPIIMSAKVAEENLAASWEVMKWLAGPERQQYSYNNFRWTPALATADFLSDFDVYTPLAIEIAKNAQYTLIDEGNPFYAAEITPAINKYQSALINGETVDIQQLLDELQTKAIAWSENQ